MFLFLRYRGFIVNYLMFSKCWGGGVEWGVRFFLGWFGEFR